MIETRLARLDSTIQANAAKIDEYLISRELPSSSFEPSFPPRLLLEASLAVSMQAIREATVEIDAPMPARSEFRRARPSVKPRNLKSVNDWASSWLNQAALQHNVLCSLQAFNRFDLDRSFPSVKGEATHAQISSISGLE